MLECVKIFRYLGRVLSMYNDDAHAVRAQLIKARSCWNRVGKVPRGENALPRVCGKFWKSIVQSILLYCSKTWVISPALLKRLEGLQI